MGITNILIVIGLILIILEIFTVTTLLIWIGIGFLAAAFTSLFTSNPIILLVVGTVACLLTMVIFRDKFKNGLLAGKQTKTSYEELIGKKAQITTGFIGNDVNRGTLKINGVEWIALANDNQVYEVNEIVIIKKIDGAKMHVEKEEK